jgi:hypothetical protein
LMQQDTQIHIVEVGVANIRFQSRTGVH